MKHHEHHHEHHDGHHGHHMSHHMHHKHHSGGHGIYKNEVEKPEMAAMGHEGPGMADRPGMGCMDFKGEADPIAYGQAGGPGMKSDHSKIEAQFKEYHWD